MMPSTGRAWPSPSVAPALQGIGVRFLGCALLSTDEAYSIDDPGVIADELCHLRLQTGSHVLCPPPQRREEHAVPFPDAS